MTIGAWADAIEFKAAAEDLARSRKHLVEARHKFNRILRRIRCRFPDLKTLQSTQSR